MSTGLEIHWNLDNSKYKLISRRPNDIPVIDIEEDIAVEIIDIYNLNDIDICNGIMYFS